MSHLPDTWGLSDDNVPDSVAKQIRSIYDECVEFAGILNLDNDIRAKLRQLPSKPLTMCDDLETTEDPVKTARDFTEASSVVQIHRVTLRKTIEIIERTTEIHVMWADVLDKLNRIAAQCELVSRLSAEL